MVIRYLAANDANTTNRLQQKQMSTPAYLPPGRQELHKCHEYRKEALCCIRVIRGPSLS